MSHTLTGCTALLLTALRCVDAQALHADIDTVGLAHGRVIVATLCAACHVELPTPKLAPPLSHVAVVYRATVGNRDTAIARMVTWIKQPDRKRALMPATDLRRFGLMPALPLPDDQLRAASTFVWTLATSPVVMTDAARGIARDTESLMAGKWKSDYITMWSIKDRSVVR